MTARRDRGWLIRYLSAPEQMLAEEDPIAVELFAKYKNVPMPNLRLSESEIAIVLSYLESQGHASLEREGQDSVSSRQTR